MEKFSILIVEDELIIAEDMKYLLNERYLVNEIAVNYEEAVEQMQKELPDIVLIDINLMSDKTGIDLAHYINSTYGIPFIFVTSLGDNHTLERAKISHPYAYVIKPFEKQNLFSTIEIALYNSRNKRVDSQRHFENVERRNVWPDVFFIKKNHHFIKVKAADIDYIKADGNYLEIMSNEEKFIVRTTLKAFEEQLNKSHFLKIHKSFIVNLEKVTAISNNHVLIKKNEVPLSAIGKDTLLSLTNRLS